MDDRRHDHVNAKIRAIVDDAIADLLLLGLDGPDQAAALMAVQSIIRIDDPEVIATVTRFANDHNEAAGG